jgi:outer membrane receptor for ferrienterochelin and colicin
MRFRYLAALVAAALLVALPAVAQEQRGSIEGVVKDSQGGAVVGATVLAKSVSTGVSVQAVTDATGTYRFAALAPGRYEVTGNLSGFAPAKVQNIDLRLGQLLTINLTLSPGAMTETVQVVAESPLIDVRQSARATSLRGEDIEKMPKGRDFASLVTQAIGVNQETAKLNGISIDGASSGENRFIIDGAESTNLQSGTQGKVMVPDFVEEVQVKSSGYTAEYGGSTGGVINVISRTGTNTWRGNAFMYWSGDALDSSSRPTLRLVPTNSNASEYVTYPEDSYNRYEPGFTLGGPLVKDKLWFFAGYNPEFTSYDRTVTFRSNNQAGTYNQKFRRNNYMANVTGQFGPKVRAKAAFQSSGYKQEGRLPSLDGTSSPTANYAINDVLPNYSGSASLDYTPSNKVYLSLRGGYFWRNLYNENVYDGTRYIFCTSNVGMAGVPPAFQGAVNTTNVPTNSSTTRDTQKRLNAQFDATFYFSGAGEHQLKAGVQFDRIANDVLNGELGNLVRIYWGRQLVSSDPTSRGTYGYYQVRSNGVFPQQGFITVGNIASNNLGLFIQDAWTVTNKLTINLGLRTENEHVPNYADPSYNLPATAIKFSFKDKLGPRAGFAYDVNGDGKWKVYGSWGIFYDIMKLELPRGSFGGDKWLEYYYSLDTYDWPNLDSSACPPQCPGTLLRGPIDFRHPSLGSDTLDPNLKPFKSMEAVAGVDHELTSVLSVSARYIHKGYSRIVEDTGSLDAQQNEIYIIGNPSEGPLKTAYIMPDGSTIPLPKPKRQYDAVELSLNKRMADHWSARAAYLWSRLYGNHTGLAQGDENGRNSPNVGRSYDYPIMMFDGSGQPVYGLLPTDRTHQFKAQLIYDFNIGLSAGVNWWAASGVPRTREVAVIPPNNFPVQYLGRNSDGRTPFFSQLDFYLQQEFKLTDRVRMTLNANVINLLNQKTAINYFPTQLASGQGVNFSEADFYAGRVNIPQIISSQNIPQDPRFMMDGYTTAALGYQGQMQARFGIGLSF